MSLTQLREEASIHPHFSLNLSISLVPPFVLKSKKDLGIIWDSALSLSAFNPSVNATNSDFKTHPKLPTALYYSLLNLWSILFWQWLVASTTAVASLCYPCLSSGPYDQFSREQQSDLLNTKIRSYLTFLLKTFQLFSFLNRVMP